MYTIRVVMPSGAESKGYERETEDEALKTYARVQKQLNNMTDFRCDVVLLEGDVELDRTTLHAA